MFPGVVGKMEGDWEGAGLLRREKGIKLGACPVLIDLGEGAVPGPVAEGKGGGQRRRGDPGGKFAWRATGNAHAGSQAWSRTLMNDATGQAGPPRSGVWWRLAFGARGRASRSVSRRRLAAFQP